MRDLIEWLIINVPAFGNWWYRTGADAPAIFIGVIGAISLVTVLSIYYQFVRRIWLRQRKFGGRWWSPDEYRGLMQVIAEDRAKGRVLSHDEKTALRNFEDGKGGWVAPWEKARGGYV